MRLFLGFQIGDSLGDDSWKAALSPKIFSVYNSYYVISTEKVWVPPYGSLAKNYLLPNYSNFSFNYPYKKVLICPYFLFSGYYEHREDVV